MIRRTVCGKHLVIGCWLITSIGTAATTGRYKMMGTDGSRGERFYRDRALLAERRALEASEPAAKQQWEEIAIEWHTLASSVGRDSDLDLV